MAQFEITGERLALRFTLLERFQGLRADPEIPLSQVASIDWVDDPWSVARGMRVGTGFPWVILVGTMIRPGGNDIVAIHGRGPAVVATFRAGARWQRWIATHPDAMGEAARLRSALSAAAPRT